MILDIAVIFIILISSVIAFLRGFIRELLTIVGVIGGTIAAWIGGPFLTDPMMEWIGGNTAEEGERFFGVIPYDLAASGLAHGSIFVLVVIVLTIISHVMSTSVKAMGLGAVDRSLGVVFGIARGVLVISLLYLPIHLFADDEQKEGWFEGSETHVYVDMVTDIIAAQLPSADEAKNEVAGRSDNIREILEDQDVLKKAEETIKEKVESAGSEAGYDKSERENMEDLMRDKLYND